MKPFRVSVGEQVGDGEHLGGQHAIESMKAEQALAMEEVGDVGWWKPGLASEQGSIQNSPVDAAEELKA